MKRFIITILAAFIGSIAQAQVMGLENNPRYKELMRQEQALRAREDSLSQRLAGVRASLRDASADQRAQLGQQILRLESEMFEVRNQTGIVTGQINALEQEFVIRNLESVKLDALPADTAKITATATPAHGNLSAYLHTALPSAEMDAWRKAGGMEKTTAGLIAQYLDNYAILQNFAAQYAAAATRERADSVMYGFNTLARVNGLIADSVAGLWSYIFDNKTYIINLVMDKADNRDFLASCEARAAQLRSDEAPLRGTFMSDAVGLYPLEKRYLLDCELALAEFAADKKTADSLRTAIKALKEGPRPLKITQQEKLFIDYQDVRLFGAPQYNSAKPIPQVEIYPRGTVYRILVGTYQYAQQPSIFRNVAPLGVLRGEDGRYRYFAGGFETQSKAEEAFETLRKAGFKAPELVVWKDGEYRNLAEEKRMQADAGQFYRVEIVSSQSTLGDDVRGVISQGGYTISRLVSTAGDGTPQYTFITGAFDDRAAAEELARAILAKQPRLNVKVAEIPAAAQ